MLLHALGHPKSPLAKGNSKEGRKDVLGLIRYGKKEVESISNLSIYCGCSVNIVFTRIGSKSPFSLAMIASFFFILTL